MARSTDAHHATHRRGIWPLVTAAEMQALDRQTIEGRGIPGEVLMESAGRALIGPVLALRAGSPRPMAPVRALCGAGNNGGDGFVLVRHLHAEGIAAEAILLGDPERLPRDAALNWARLEAVGAARSVVDPVRTPEAWEAFFDETGMVVDALFGTGLARAVEGGLAGLIDALNVAHFWGLPVLSVDIPSGIDADTGRVLGVAVEADRTVTISLPKVGLALEPGRSHAGRIDVARVGIDDPDPARLPRVESWDAHAAARHFPPRLRSGHKGSFGHVLVVAGSAGKLGAAALCSRAAARAGAGLVTLAHPVASGEELGSIAAEVMTETVAATVGGGFAHTAQQAIESLAAARDVVALGPGVGQDPETAQLVRGLASQLDCPLVIDADGLNALVGHLDRLHGRRLPAILTPHPGEASRLLAIETAQINADRVASARRLAIESHSIVLLKGAGTIVADPDGRTLVIPTGGPALATGGTGDVLTGVVAALLAGGVPAFEAAGLAAWWHGATADRSLEARVGFGLLAGELADSLPECAAWLLERCRGEESGGELELRFPGT